MNRIPRSKFNVNSDPAKRTYDNVLYDSELEMRFYRDWLLPRIESGEVVKCDKQVTYELQPKFKHKDKTILPIKYVADYVVAYKNGKVQVVDTKGFADAQALLKKKMFYYKYPNIDYIWISFSQIDGGWILYEDLKKARAKRKKEKAKIQANKDKFKF